MRHLSSALAAAMLIVATAPASASTYIALGDSITFGETDLNYVQSYGVRSYVSGFANYLAARNGGVAPAVINLAIDGETTGSFTSNVGRTPPVAGRTDQPLQLENLDYTGDQVAQGTLFAQTVQTQAAAQNPVTTISVTLGFNNLAALAGTNPSDATVQTTLATYQTQYAGILSTIRSTAPAASLYLLGYYNPFPADPASPAAPLFNTYGTELNGIIQSLAGQFGATYVDVAPGFVGREAELTYLDEQPHGFFRTGTFSGTEPIGNVHPNDAGYAVITQRLDAAAAGGVPEPASWSLMLVGFGAVGFALRRRAADRSAHVAPMRPAII